MTRIGKVKIRCQTIIYQIIYHSLNLIYLPWILEYVLSNSSMRILFKIHIKKQKYSRLRCLLRVKGLVICFYLGWSGSILQFRQSIKKVGSKSWLLTCSSNITLSLTSYTGSALKRELNFCNDYLSLLYFWQQSTLFFQ